MRRRSGKSYGISTGEPRPVGIDDYTGFKVHLDTLQKDWQGLRTQDPDIRNPQDFVRGVKDNSSLPFARPEAPDTFVALPLLWQDGRIMTTQTGDVILGEGLNPADTL